VSGLGALERQLQTRAPEGVRALPDAELHALAEAIAAARRRQAAELEAAGDKALALVPRLLRGPVRRLAG
jgi:hypothetical protein